MKKLLITGSNGFIGKSLKNYYKNKFNVIEFKRNDNIFDALALKPEYIINTAADIYQPETMFDSNVFLVEKLLNYVKDTKIKMIQIGSSAEYGRKIYPTKETDFLDPTNMYEGTKAAATMLCIGMAKEYNLPIAVARPYSVFGCHEKPHRLFPKLYDAFVYDKDMILNQGYHDFIYIKDFINGINILLESDNEKICGDVVNFGSGVQTSNYDVLNIFESIFKKKSKNIKIIDSFAKKFESNVWVADIKYSQEKYNFLLEYNIKNGIIDFIKEKNEFIN